MNIQDWVELGVRNGWCSEVVCATHDGVPGTPEEDAEWEAGHDPCQPVVRLWLQTVSMNGH